jgi:hypothetical protein
LIRVVLQDYDKWETYTGQVWRVNDDDSLVILDSRAVAVARFAKGVWAYVERVNEEDIE